MCFVFTVSFLFQLVVVEKQRVVHWSNFPEKLQIAAVVPSDAMK